MDRIADGAIEYENIVRRQRFEGAGLERPLMEKYYTPQFYITLTLYNQCADARADSKVIEAFRTLAQKNALITRPRRLRDFDDPRLRLRTSVLTRRGGKVVRAKKLKKRYKDDLYKHGPEVEPMLDTHISWFGYSDYQPKRYKRVLHYHMFPDFDRDVSIDDVKKKLNSIWYFGDVRIREYNENDGSIPYSRFKHENYIDGVACRRVDRGIDGLCCKAGRVCRYTDENGKHSAMWFARNNN